jgi:hypothetical protein
MVGLGFLVLAGLVLFIGSTGLSFGAIAFVLVLVIIGVALILSAYFQPDIAEKKTLMLLEPVVTGLL